MAIQNASLRRLGTGDFRALAQAMAVDPAMLVWLDGGGNRVGQAQREPGARVHGAVHPRGRATTPRTTSARRRGRSPAGRSTSRARSATLRAQAPRRRPRDGARQVRRSTRRAWWTCSSGMPGVGAAFLADAGVDPVRLRYAARPGHARHARGRLRPAATTSPRWCGPPSARPRSATRRSVLVREPVLWLTGALRALNVPASKVPAGFARRRARRAWARCRSRRPTSAAGPRARPGSPPRRRWPG